MALISLQIDKLSLAQYDAVWRTFGRIVTLNAAKRRQLGMHQNDANWRNRPTLARSNASFFRHKVLVVDD